MKNPEFFSSYRFGYENAIGWLTDEEASELTRLAVGRTVMEVGTFCGRSALAMLRTANKVYCVDHFQGYDATKELNIRDMALGNFDRARVWDKLIVMHGSQEDVLPRMNLREIEMVFYDADHSFEATWSGIQMLHAAGLPLNATVAFHDSDEAGVAEAVRSYASEYGREYHTVGSLAVFEGEPAKPTVTHHSVMLAIPHNGTLHWGAAEAQYRATTLHQVRIHNMAGSLLANQFNHLLCAALNEAEQGAITHLAFLHADICPEDFWIDKLMAELEETGADFVSVVSPIKDVRGLTSCGIADPRISWHPKKRFTMRELAKLPETFSIEDTDFPDDVLLHNSGCWIADLRKMLFHQTNEDGSLKCFFTINDKVIRNEGKWVPMVEPEDWFFSRRLHECGARTFVTRKVKLSHAGLMEFRNDSAWGDWEHDKDTEKFWKGNGNA